MASFKGISRGGLRRDLNVGLTVHLSVSVYQTLSQESYRAQLHICTVTMQQAHKRKLGGIIALIYFSSNCWPYRHLDAVNVTSSSSGKFDIAETTCC